MCAFITGKSLPESWHGVYSVTPAPGQGMFRLVLSDLRARAGGSRITIERTRGGTAAARHKQSNLALVRLPGRECGQIFFSHYFASCVWWFAAADSWPQ